LANSALLCCVLYATFFYSYEGHYSNTIMQLTITTCYNNLLLQVTIATLYYTSHNYTSHSYSSPYLYFSLFHTTH